LRSKTVPLGFLIISLLAFSSTSTSIAQDQSSPLELTVFTDGFVEINHNILLNQSTLSIVIGLLGETRQNIMVLEENGLPIDYSITTNRATIYTLGASKINLSYLTPDLTTKIGKYWTIKIDYPESRKIILPENTSIISLSIVPDLIENSGSHLSLTLPPGYNEITYTVEPTIDNQTQITNNDPIGTWQLIVLVFSTALITAFALAFLGLRNKKKNKSKQKIQEHIEVDVEKLLSKHRELRRDEIQVIHFLASKGGKAFEAELFELLTLPRTTTWRLIRRLEGMEIVHIRKSRRQNIVLIREKYLKSPKKP
jgi:uncharacterized membrane protein